MEEKQSRQEYAVSAMGRTRKANGPCKVRYCRLRVTQGSLALEIIFQAGVVALKPAPDGQAFLTVAPLLSLNVRPFCLLFNAMALSQELRITHHRVVSSDQDRIVDGNSTKSCSISTLSTVLDCTFLFRYREN